MSTFSTEMIEMALTLMTRMRINEDCERDPNELPGMDLNSSPSGWGGSSAYINVDTFAYIGPEWIQIGPCGTN